MLDLDTPPPYLALSLAIFLVVYAVRRWLPKLWEPLTRWPDTSNPLSVVIQALPSLIAGAASAGVATGDALGAVKGAVAGALAPFVHHVLKWLPVPYRGEVRS